MLRHLRVVFFVLSCQAAFADSRTFADKIVDVTPTNTADNRVVFNYTNDYVEVGMPITAEARPFSEAILECTNSMHPFTIPLYALKLPDVIFIHFRMDRQLLRECILRVSFQKDVKMTVYVFSLMDFIPKVEASSIK
jgi:hypothetical protein